MQELRLNLFWLSYVSYALVAAAACLYLAVRLNRLTRRAAVKATIFYVACIVLACVLWRVQETNAAHSPRHLVVGTVASVTEIHHRGGGVDYEFRLKLGGGSLSPSFFTGDIGEAQPIHQGDLLGVLYRTWDNVPLSIDELQGQNAGWHYSRNENRSGYVFGVAVAGLVGLLSLLFSLRTQRPKAAVPEPTMNLKD